MSEAAELLLDLKDIHEPLAPATASAFLLGLIALTGALLMFGVIGFWIWRRKTLNRVVQQELAIIRQHEHNSGLHQLAVLLRRVMHHVHGDSINHLQNEQWLERLDKTFSTNYFSEGRGAVFGEPLYQHCDALRPAAHPDLQLLCSDLHKLVGRIRLRTGV